MLVGGSAMSVPPRWKTKAAAAALLVAGYGGEEAGAGLADVLLGLYNPAGRLPYTVPTVLRAPHAHTMIVCLGVVSLLLLSMVCSAPPALMMTMDARG